MNDSLYKQVKIIKMRKNGKIFELLSLNELALAKGGEERDYVIVIIDGKEVRIYV